MPGEGPRKQLQGCRRQTSAEEGRGGPYGGCGMREWPWDVACENGRDRWAGFQRQGHTASNGNNRSKGAEQEATVGLVRIGGALSSTALPLCNPFSTSENLVPPTFRGSQSAGKD